MGERTHLRPCPPLFSTDDQERSPQPNPQPPLPTWNGTWPPTSFPQHQPPIRTESAVGKRHQPGWTAVTAILSSTQPSLDPVPDPVPVPVPIPVRPCFGAALHCASLHGTAYLHRPWHRSHGDNPPILRARRPNRPSLRPSRRSAPTPLTVIPMPSAAVLPRQ